MHTIIKHDITSHHIAHHITSNIGRSSVNCTWQITHSARHQQRKNTLSKALNTHSHVRMRGRTAHTNTLACRRRRLRWRGGDSRLSTTTRDTSHIFSAEFDQNKPDSCCVACSHVRMSRRESRSSGKRAAQKSITEWHFDRDRCAAVGWLIGGDFHGSRRRRRRSRCERSCVRKNQLVTVVDIGRCRRRHLARAAF